MTLSGLLTATNTVGDYGAYQRKPGEGWEKPIQRCLADWGEAYMLPGTYTPSSVITIDRAGSCIRGSKQAFFKPSSASPGIFNVTASNVTLQGFQINVDAPVNNQVAVLISGAHCTVSDVTITYGGTGSTTNPTTGIHAANAQNITIRDVSIFPTTGVIGARISTGVGYRVDNLSILSGQNLDTPNVVIGVTIRDCWIGLWLDSCSFGHVNNFRAEKIGSYFATQLGGVVPKAMIYVSGGTSSDEAGHMLISKAQIELVASDTPILVEDCHGWIDIVDCQVGFSGNQVFKRGDAAVKVTGTTATSQNIVIDGLRIHNLGRTPAVADALATDAATAQAISVTAATKTYTKTTGSWARTPLAGEYVIGGSFSDALNNGYHRVVSATSNTVVVEETLADEASGTRTLKTITPFEGAAVYLEKCTNVEVTNLRCSNMRHAWAVAMDTATIRGVVVDGVYCHKGSGVGALAAVMVPSGALLTADADPNDSEGLSIQNITMKGFGAGSIPIAQALITGANLNAAAATAQVASNITGAAVTFGTFGDSGNEYLAHDAATAIEELSTFRRIS